MSLIRCKDLSYSYDGDCVLSEVNFEVNEGEYLTVIGENGSGKSTLVKCILGLQKPEGDVIFGDGLQRNQIGYLPQSVQIKKDFPASVFEVVLSGRLNSLGFKPFYSQKDLDEANSCIDMIGISDLKEKSFQELSGGQQQRTLLARALCATKKLILLDEPVAGLDPAATEEMYNIIKNINKQGISVVMVTHDILSVFKYSSHVLHLGGKQLFFGTRKDYTASAAAQIYLSKKEFG